jgi:hypothetical protein
MPLQNSYTRAAYERHIGIYVFKERTVEPWKQPLLDNGCVTCNNGLTAGCGVFCVIHAKAIYQGQTAIMEHPIQK